MHEAMAALRSIEAAALNHAAALPLEETAEVEWQGIAFQVGGVRLLAAMGQVSEVLKLPRVTTLPMVKPWVLGVANIRGRLIPVIDLHQYLGIAPTLPRAQWRVLVVEEGELVAGLLVEQSLGMLHFPESAMGTADVAALGALASYVQGAYRQSGRIFYDTQLKAILRDEKFFDVAQPIN